MSLKLFQALAFVAFYAMSIGMAYPLFAIFLQYHGMSATYIGFSYGASAIVTFIVTPYYPRMFAYLGYRKIIFISIPIWIVLIISFALVRDKVIWMIIKGFTGFVFGLAFLAGELWVQSLTTDTNRGRILGTYSVVLSASFAIGSGILALTGTTGMLPFFGASFICILALICSINAPSKKEAEKTQPFVKHVTRLFKLAPVIFLSIGVFALIDQSLSPLLPVFATQHGLDDYYKPLLMAFLSVGGMIGQPLTGYLLDKSKPDKFLNKHNIFVMYYFGAFLWSLSLFFIDSITNPIFMILLFAVGGVFFLGSYTITITIMGGKFKGQDLVLMYTVNAVLWSVGSLIGPSVAGMAMDLSKYGLPALVSILIFAILIILVKIDKSWTNDNKQTQE